MLKKLFGGKKNEFFLELDEAKNGQSAKSPKAEKPAAEPVAKIEVAEEPKAAKEQPKAQKSKKKSLKKSEPKPAPAPATPASMNGKVAKKEEPTEVEFATKYLITPTGSRRRPGPSLNSFKNMARQVKVPRG